MPVDQKTGLMSKEEICLAYAGVVNLFVAVRLCAGG